MTTLTMKQEKRLEVIQRVFRGELTVVETAMIVGVSERLKARPAREETKSVSVPAAKSGQYTVETGDTLSYLALKLLWRST